MVVSGFEKTWPYYYGLFGDGLGVSWPRPILYRSDLDVDKSKMEVSGRESFLAVFGTDLAAIASAQWPSKKNDVDRKRSIDRDGTKRATRINASSTWVQVEGRVIMHVFTFSYEKLASVTMRGNGLSIAFGNPEKTMPNSICLVREASLKLDLCMVFPR